MEKAGRMFKAAIFDMDGLILDSERTVLKCWEKVQISHGLPDIMPFAVSVIGKIRKRLLRNSQECSDFLQNLMKPRQEPSTTTWLPRVWYR